MKKLRRSSSVYDRIDSAITFLHKYLTMKLEYGNMDFPEGASLGFLRGGRSLLITFFGALGGLPLKIWEREVREVSSPSVY